MLTLLLALSLANIVTAKESLTSLSIEEMRIAKAKKAMPSVITRMHKQVDKFSQQLQQARNYTALTQLVIVHGKTLWKQAKLSFNQQQDFDDRPLYWTRLQMSKVLRQAPIFASLLPDQQAKLLWDLELFSRGVADIDFNKNSAKKILITGFDPFFLDKNIAQSNPSGVAALALDDLLLSMDNKNAQIQTLMIPVRFADFDQGMIEEMLTPYLKNQKIDLLVTMSMGRKNFDLERFPALRRSAKAPDNLNVFTGADKNHPLVPQLKNKKLVGAEFVEFSLPANKMQQAQGDYKININNKVSILEKGEVRTFYPKSISELANKISVQGSGGGYLSNEVSYRSILLRNKYAPILPVGHIHTPRISRYKSQTNKAIVQQIKAMLTLAVGEI
ncbi:MAG: hypothetical protein COB35_07800 [Gammaproteobacteria bacterium]|nr:MAG: hypothetical protein COB35_07800 [Gammaproteobacteria bacterium]